IRLSKQFTPTLKAEQIGNEQVESVGLLMRGGYIRQSSSGFFTLLPNGYRMVKKIERLIDEEMEAIGASRLEMPTMLSSNLWHKSGRFETMGSELYKLKDRKQTEFILAPTFEEEVTKLIGEEVQSYKQLPIKVYQITSKHRDEPRPRSGLLRTRGFIMKDLYTFDATVSDAERSYEEVRAAYDRIMTRLFGPKGSGWQVAEADTGAMGGLRSHEYQVQDPLGEDALISCNHCDYSANIEKAASFPRRDNLPIEASEVDVSLHGASDPSFHGCTLTAVVAPKGRTIHPIKLKEAIENGQYAPNTISTDQLSPLPATEGENGNSNQWDWKDRPEGPIVRFDHIRILLDHECAALEPEEVQLAVLNAAEQFGSPSGTSSKRSSGSEGAPTLHDYFGAQFASAHDAIPQEYVDIRQAEVNDTCASCGKGQLQEAKAVEVGHTFLLGTRYSKALNYQFMPDTKTTSSKNEPALFQMGCYGIGLTRILGVLAQNAQRTFDKLNTPMSQKQTKVRKGFAWNPEIAPFKALVLTSDLHNEKQAAAVESLCNLLTRRVSKEDESPWDTVLSRSGLCLESDIAIDDRSTMSIGAKLNEADLIGYPLVFILGKHFDKNGEVEVRYLS
ncbi:class II aaRS and biotin synthetase, partial [Meira miltonrushii]